jgi:hypothetical protein
VTDFKRNASGIPYVSLPSGDVQNDGSKKLVPYGSIEGLGRLVENYERDRRLIKCLLFAELQHDEELRASFLLLRKHENDEAFDEMLTHPWFINNAALLDQIVDRMAETTPESLREEAEAMKATTERLVIHRKTVCLARTRFTKYASASSEKWVPTRVDPHWRYPPESC